MAAINRLLRRPDAQAAVVAALHAPPIDTANMVVDDFHRLYYDAGDTWRDTSWFGVPIRKLPLDLWMYQEILYETRPDVIVECGTFLGGSALYLAHLLDILKQGRIVTIDVQNLRGRPEHERIEYLSGSSVDPAIVESVHQRTAGAERVMVILDSAHDAQHVAAELAIYSNVVTAGCYLVVEDTNVNGHPVMTQHGPGPGEALAAFLAGSRGSAFIADRRRERFLVSFNPGGYLRRVEA
jgi:cephalosporin hydroxylase